MRDSRSRSRSYRSRSPRSRSPMRRSRYSGAHRRSFSKSRSRSFSPNGRGGRIMSRSRSRSRGGPNRSRSRSRSRSRISRSRSYSRSRSRSRSPGRSNRKKVKEDPYPLYRVSVVKALHLQSDYRDQRHAGSSKELEQKLLEACTLYVGNLSFYTTEEQVYELFSKVGEVKRIIMGLDRFKKTPCGFCFIEYYTREDAADCIKFISGTKLDDRIIRCDWDAGFVEGRQYGRGKSGGQVRDDYRDDFDSGRGGYGGGGQPQAREYAQYHGGSQNILNAGPGGGLAGGTRAGSKSNTDRKRARGESESGNGKRARRRSGSDSGRGEDDDDDGELVGAEAGDASTAEGTAANEDKEHEANEMEDSVDRADADDEVPAESALEDIVDEDLDGDGAEGMEDADDA